MSAYIVSKTHVDALVTVAQRSRPPYGKLSWYWNGERRDASNGDRTFSMLWSENARSVEHRYAEGEAIEMGYDPSASFSRVSLDFDPKRTPLQIFAALDGYEYQSSEHPDWPESEARAFCDALRKDMIRSLPGYDGASTWNIDDRQALAARPLRLAGQA